MFLFRFKLDFLWFSFLLVNPTKTNKQTNMKTILKEMKWKKSTTLKGHLIKSSNQHRKTLKKIQIVELLSLSFWQKQS
jgi:hypothetical protein